MLFNKTYSFPGPYGTMVRFLTNYDDKGLKIFNRNIDLYMVSAAIGIQKNLMGEPTDLSSSTDDLVKIMPEQFFKEYDNLQYLYVMAMLNYKGAHPEDGELSEEERIQRAFKYPNQNTNDSEHDNQESAFIQKMNSECMKVFNRYVLGGLRYIYDYFKDVKIKSDLSPINVDHYIIKFAMDNLNLTEEDFEQIAK